MVDISRGFNHAGMVRVVRKIVSVSKNMSPSNGLNRVIGIGLVISLAGCGGNSSPAKPSSALKPVAFNAAGEQGKNEQVKEGGSSGSSMSANVNAPAGKHKEGVAVDSDLYYPVGPLAARMITRRDAGGPIAWPPVSEWGLKETAADALARIGGDAVTQLIGALHDPEPQVRLQAVRALARIGPDAAPAVAALTERLTDSDLLVRQNAARALGQIGPAAKSAIPQLIQALQTEKK